LGRTSKWARDAGGGLLVRGDWRFVLGFDLIAVPPLIVVVVVLVVVDRFRDDIRFPWEVVWRVVRSVVAIFLGIVVTITNLVESVFVSARSVA
jgi:hypothetical protein